LPIPIFVFVFLQVTFILFSTVSPAHGQGAMSEFQGVLTIQLSATANTTDGKCPTCNVLQQSVPAPTKEKPSYSMSATSDIGSSTITVTWVEEQTHWEVTQKVHMAGPQIRLSPTSNSFQFSVHHITFKPITIRTRLSYSTAGLRGSLGSPSHSYNISLTAVSLTAGSLASQTYKGVSKEDSLGCPSFNPTSICEIVPDTLTKPQWKSPTLRGESASLNNLLQDDGYNFDSTLTTIVEVKAATIHNIEVTQAIQELQSLEELRASLKAGGEPPVAIVAHKRAVLRVYTNDVDIVTNVQVRVSLTDAPSSKVPLTLLPGCDPGKQRRRTSPCESYDYYFSPPEGSWDVTVELLDTPDTLLDTTGKLTFSSRTPKPLLLKGVSVADTMLMGRWLFESADKLDTSLLEKLAPTDRVIRQITGNRVMLNVNDRSGLNGDYGLWWRMVVKSLNEMYSWFDTLSDSYVTYFGVVSPAVFGPAGKAAGSPSHGAAGLSSAKAWKFFEVRPQIVAHEVFHTLGLLHTDKTEPVSTSGPPGCWSKAENPRTDWPYLTNQLQSGRQLEVGFDVTAKHVVLPDSSAASLEIMGYCAPQWISPFSYRKAMTILAPKSAAPAVSSLKPRAAEAADFWLVSGNISESGLTFNPLFQNTMKGPIDQGEGPYRIEVQDAFGSVLFTRPFRTYTPVIEETDTDSGPASFIELVPVTAGAASIVVFDVSNVQLGTITLAGIAPNVALTAPAAGSTQSGVQDVTWLIDDPDSAQFTSKVLYSVDGAGSWTQLGEMTGTVGLNSLNVDFDTLPGGTSVYVKLLVSDGVNTGQAMSGPLAVRKKTNIIADVSSPSPNTVFKSGDFVPLSGDAYDIDDGVLDGNAIRWESDLDGPLGTGARLALTTLRPGSHRITMTATDSDGNNALQVVPIRIAGAGPSLDLTVTAVQTAPTTCMQVSIKPTAGSVELAQTDYSLDGGNTWIPIAGAGSFIMPGSGSLDIIARTSDVAGQVAAKEAQFSTAGACQQLR
jgi:hypothetical protein